ncbi:MAG: hypothetical protein KDE47_08825, partial [Caldilineaceae bacterium]|nr:hypothetical protein [Caldilineaceae bacterium]
MKRNVLTILLVCGLLALTTNAQTVSNVSFDQERDGSGIVTVYYTLEGDSAGIGLEIAPDGVTFQVIPFDYLSGDAGWTIAPGEHQIFLDLLSYGAFFSNTARFRVRTLVPPVISENVEVINPDSTEVLSYNEDTGLIQLVSQGELDLEVGDILFGTPEHPFIRQIVSIETERTRDGAVIQALVTWAIGLFEAVTSGEFAESVCLDFEEAELVYLAEGARATRNDRFGWNLDGTVLFHQQSGGLDISVTMPEAHINFDPCIDVAMRIESATLELFSIQSRIETDIAASFLAEASATHSEEAEVTVAS